jgi:hypothetical protein
VSSANSASLNCTRSMFTSVSVPSAVVTVMPPAPIEYDCTPATEVSITAVSVPAPPSSVSLPLTPSRRSLPEVPTRWSSPVVPWMVPGLAAAATLNFST